MRTTRLSSRRSIVAISFQEPQARCEEPDIYQQPQKKHSELKGLIAEELTNCKAAQHDIGCPCELVGQEFPLLFVHTAKSYSGFPTPSNQVRHLLL